MPAPNDTAIARATPSACKVDSTRRLKRTMADLVATGSLEMGAHRPKDAARSQRCCRAGTPVFVNHLPRHTLSETLDGLVAARHAGLEPVPHLAARRIGSRQEVARRSSSARSGRPASRRCC